MIKDDLISRSDLLKEIEKSMNNNMHKSPKTRYSHRLEHMHFLQIVSKVPAAYDVELVCKELEKLKELEIDMSDEEPNLEDSEDVYDEGRSQGRIEAYSKAIEIVRNGGTALDLPENISAVCHDLNMDIARRFHVSDREAFDMSREQIMNDLCGPEDIVTGNKHNSLYDAEVIRAIWKEIH